MSSIDPLEYASTLDERTIETGQIEGKKYGYQRGFRQGFNRGLDYALENHGEIARIAAHCEQLQSTSESRQKRLLNGILESCREFRLLIPDVPRYAELLSSIRARYQHLTGTTTNAKSDLTF